MGNVETAATTPVAAVGDEGAAGAAAGAADGAGAAPMELAVGWGRGSLGTPEPRAAWATRLRWGGCRCRRIGFGRRRLRWRCFPRVCRWQPQAPTLAPDWVSHSHSAGYRGPQLWAPRPARAVLLLLLANMGHASRWWRAHQRLDTQPNRQPHRPRDIRCPRPHTRRTDTRRPGTGRRSSTYRPTDTNRPTHDSAAAKGDACMRWRPDGERC